MLIKSLISHRSVLMCSWMTQSKSLKEIALKASGVWRSTVTEALGIEELQAHCPHKERSRSPKYRMQLKTTDTILTKSPWCRGKWSYRKSRMLCRETLCSVLTICLWRLVPDFVWPYTSWLKSGSWCVLKANTHFIWCTVVWLYKEFSWLLTDVYCWLIFYGAWHPNQGLVHTR